MRPDHRINFFFRMLMGCCAVSGLVLISGNGRSAMAQVPSTQITVLMPFDPSTVTAPPAPAYSAFSVTSGPSLVYQTFRDPKTGIASLAGIQVDPKSKLVVTANSTGLPYPFVYVSVKFTVGNASKTYYISEKVAVSGGVYTVDPTKLSDLITRFANDLNQALPPGFDPGGAVPFSSTIQIGVTPIESIDNGPPIKVTTGPVVNLNFKMPVKRTLGLDEARPQP
jgi:hypothetical protein